MFQAKIYKTFLTIFMAFMISNLPHVVFAETADQMISTTEVVESLTRSQAEAKVRSYLDRQDFQSELVKMGLSPAEVSKRVASLSDSELKQLATQMDQARYGGDIFGILILVLVVVLIIYLVKRI
jgi:hypothetical protein